VLPSLSHINTEREALGKPVLTDAYVTGTWKRRTNDTTQRITSLEEFYRDMIHGQE